MKRILLIFVLCMPLMVMAQRSICSSRIEVTPFHDGQVTDRMRAILAPYKASVDSMMAPVLGRSAVAMSAGRPESLLGNWTADALVEFSDIDGAGRADMGLANVGGIRNNMPKGVVRRGDVMLISPFQNKLTIVTLKGEDLLELFRNIASVGGEAVSREVRMVISRGGDLKTVMLSGKTIDPQRTYRVATLDYLAEGNDKMVALKRAVSKKVYDLFTRDVMMQAIERTGTIDAKIEGRIVVE